MGRKSNARVYNIISLIFVLLSIVVIIYVVVRLLGPAA
jgi:flagellar biogenesis protein FliO